MGFQLTKGENRRSDHYLLDFMGFIFSLSELEGRLNWYLINVWTFDKF